MNRNVSDKIGDSSENRPYRDVVGRRALPHDPPLWVDPTKEVFFITICCEQRGVNQLCDAESSHVLFEAVRFYERQGKWFLYVMVLMPDHIHCLASFAMDVRMKKLISDWKRYAATNTQIKWQRDFFDHRLRSDESWGEKADYILANPVRAGLVKKWEDWPYVLLPEQFPR